MNQEPDPRQRYQNHGAALLQGLFAPEIVAAISYQLSEQVARTGTAMLAPPSLGDKPCYEAYGYALPVLATFLWGLTPQIETLTGCRLLPTYCYFRTYQQGDVCRVHTDRPACEHSLSLTLGYADGIAWALSVSERPLAPDAALRQTRHGEADFGAITHVDLPMQPGDAVLYRGVDHAHGRLLPNPNRWSAHLFMHWVDRNGPYADRAFDRQQVGGLADFVFPSNPEQAVFT